jgi:hypothetical protein
MKNEEREDEGVREKERPGKIFLVLGSFLLFFT